MSHCVLLYCCLQRHCVTSGSVSPSVQRSMHHNTSAPSSPVRAEVSDSRTFGSHGIGGDSLHRQHASVPQADPTRTHSSMSDNITSYHANKRHLDTQRDSGYSDRSRVDHEYSDYAYVRALAVNYPQMKDAATNYQVVGSRGTSDGGYQRLHWLGHRAERPPAVGGQNSQQQMDASLYHLASNRTVSYAGSDELQSTMPITATAMTSRFLDPTPRWLTKHGSLEGAYRQRNGELGNKNLYAANSPYAGSEASLPDRSYDVVPRKLGSPPVHYETPPHLRAAAANTSSNSIELSPADPSAVVLHGQNYIEVSKPFEMADVYKYSARMRHPTAANRGGDRTADLRSTSSPQLTHSREPRYQPPAYTAPTPQYFPSRHYQEPAFD